MKRNFLIITAVVFLFVFILTSNKSNAFSIIGAPGDDGTKLFMPSQTVFSVELLDEGLGVYPSTFGFYFQSDPSNLIAIFGFEDQDPDPGGPGSTQQEAMIDFLSGKVYDFDDPNFSVDPNLAIQSTFTPGLNPIGFFYGLDLTSSGLGGSILMFTDPLLNGGVDMAATFPIIPNSYSIGFEYFEYLDRPVSFEIVSGVTSVPEPSTLILLAFGLPGLAVWRKKYNKSN